MTVTSLSVQQRGQLTLAIGGSWRDVASGVGIEEDDVANYVSGSYSARPTDLARQLVQKMQCRAL